MMRFLSVCPRFLICFWLGALLPSAAHPQSVLHLRQGPVSVSPNAATWLDSISTTQPSAPVLAMVHFAALPTQAQQADLGKAGVSLLEYVTDYTYTALVSFPVDTEITASFRGLAFLNVQPEWKAGNYLWNLVKTRKGPISLVVSFVPGTDPAAIKAMVARLGGQIVYSGLEPYGYWKMTLAADQVAALAQWYAVRGIAPSGPMVNLDLDSRPSVKGNTAVSSPVYGGYGLKGDSVTVGVGDDASGIYHADIRDRITNFNPAPRSNHGEHVNGIVGSAANIDPLAEGMAPHVSLLDFLYDLILPATGAMYQDYNMTLTNNSYEIIAGACDYMGVYDIYSQLVDTLELQYPYVQHVFASGNDGYLTCGPYPNGFGTVGGGYQPAKNNIVVGSLTDFYTEAPDESRGPVADGRLKPDIEATGLIAYSTVGVDQYEWAAGTSMASPHIAGGLAVLTQRYKQLHGGANPRADLLKAVALNGAMDLGNPGPDYAHGFGEMDLYRSLTILDSNWTDTGSIANGDSLVFTVNIPPGTGQARIMLCWNDPPGSPYAATELVNDLDLTAADASGATHLPLVPDPTPANVNSNATERPDHLNNVEQVTLNSPAPGICSVIVKGYLVPHGPQHFVVAWDLQPKALHLTYPQGGEQLLSAGTPYDTLRIFWDAVTDGNTFKVETSQDNGATWTTASDTIPATARYYGLIPNGLSTGNYRVRVSRNNTTESATSGRLSFNAQPVIQLDTAQCPGYVNIHWSPVANASEYLLLRKTGFYLQVVDSTTDTAYSFSGMPVGVYTYVTVQPVIDGVPGYRAVAVKSLANSGYCTKTVSVGDIALSRILAPVSGRRYTRSQLGTMDSVKVMVADRYTAACDSYTLSWQVNGSPWQSVTTPSAIPANGAIQVSAAGPDLSAPGSYAFRVAVHNLRVPDPQPANDTLSFTILNLANDTLRLDTALNDGFEALPKIQLTHDSLGLSANGYWDFQGEPDSGRVRSYVNDAITITGTRSISLDATSGLDTGSRNIFTGTFNLSAYDTAHDEVRIDFDYVLHGNPKTSSGNIVLGRASDSLDWSTLYNYNLGAYPGFVTNVRSLSITDLAIAQHRNFSSSTQVAFCQNDTSLIAAIDYGNGMTLDNFRMYTVVHDAQLLSVVSPLPNNCLSENTAPLTVLVRNGVNTQLYNLKLFAQVDGGAIMSGIIDSLGPKKTIDYTFAGAASMLTGQSHSLNIWLSEAGDSYSGNDSILNYAYRNSQVYSSFPYVEHFENGDGGYYSGGFRDSWQYGKIASTKINKAAGGTIGWKTNLTGNYNNLELSYLYSPCFDLSSLKKPMLSFSAAMDIENCGNTLCDAAWVEVSYDGATWTKLGSFGQGTHWYDSTFDVWNTEGFTRWHVASVLLPQPGPGFITHLRFVMSADPGVTFEGVALNDISIYDFINPIYQGPTPAFTLTDLSGSVFSDQILPAGIIASINPYPQTLDSLVTTVYQHDTLFNPGATQYTFPRSYSIKASPVSNGNVQVRMYLTDSEFLQVFNDTTCPSCTPVPDAYSLGVTQYRHPGGPANENGTMTDDTGGIFTYYPPGADWYWLPYDKGYFAQLPTKNLSEFWFNNGGPTGNFPAGIDYLNFMAFKTDSAVRIFWNSSIDTATDSYFVERSPDGLSFSTIKDTLAEQVYPAQYTFPDYPDFTASPSWYYRLRGHLAGGTGYYYSPVRKVNGTDTLNGVLSFTISLAGYQTVLNTWSSTLDGITDHYTLERAIGDGPWQNITKVASVQHYGQNYSYPDVVRATIANGTPVNYRLIASLADGSQIITPIHTVAWFNANSLVNVYPNPTHDHRLSIDWYAVPGTKALVNLFDMDGKLVFKANAESAQWLNSTTLQLLGAAAAGVYNLKMMIGGVENTARVVVE